MIVKVQRSLFPDRTQLLIYDKQRTFQLEQQITPEVEKLMGAKPKVFFHAQLKGDQVELLHEAEWQEW